MGANVFSRPRTQRDVFRMFAQVSSEPTDARVHHLDGPGKADIIDGYRRVRHDPCVP
jgi:hypothetical protein